MRQYAGMITEPRYRVTLRVEIDHGIQYVTIEIRDSRGLIGHPILLEDNSPMLSVATRRAKEELRLSDAAWERDVVLTIQR